MDDQKIERKMSEKGDKMNQRGSNLREAEKMPVVGWARSEVSRIVTRILRAEQVWYSLGEGAVNLG